MLVVDYPYCKMLNQAIEVLKGNQVEDDFEIYLLKSEGIETYTLGQLLPVSFQPTHIS